MASSVLPEMLVKANRGALICQLVATYSDTAERKRLIMRFWEAGLISDDAAEIMIEHFGLEAA